MNLLLGADPEVFAKRGDEFLSAFGMIQGDKKNPFRVKDGAVQVDGMALEFNIDPASNEEEFTFNIQSVMAQLAALVPTVQITATPVAYFSEHTMMSQPDEALDLGCDPDFNAWTGDENIKPIATKPMRTGAGHVHFGWTADAINDAAHLGMCSALMKQCDFYLGLPSLLFDSAVERRELYGKAGAFRPKSYGAEYRVLSNVWLSDDKLTRWVYRASRACFESMMSGPTLDVKYGDIQSIINTSDVDAAMRIIRAEGLVVPEGV